MNPRQKFIFCRWPVLRWLTRLVALSAICTTSNIFSIRLFTSAVGMP